MSAVTRLPRDPGVSGWSAILSAPPDPKSVDGTETADWLVIGAGFAGLAAAHRLSQIRPEDRIVVLDAKRVGEGPAGRNSGFMIDLPHDLSSSDYGGALDSDAQQIADNRFAIDFAESMAQQFGLPDEAFVRSGKVNASATEAGDRHNRTYAAHLDALGEPSTLLDAAGMQNLTGMDYYRSGLVTPGAAMIQPAMFVRGVAAGMRSNRVEVFENSPVTALNRSGDWEATTPKGRVRAPKVILAVNGHLQSFGHRVGRLVHVHTYASMTRRLTQKECEALGGAPVWGATPADPLGTTVRRVAGEGGDRIVIRNRFTYDPALAPERNLDGVWQDHMRSFIARFPMLADVEVEYRWGGRLCLSRNGVQVINEVEPGLFTACCQNGLGTVKGTFAGIMAADLAAGHHSERLARIKALALPSKLPPEPLATLGATVRLRWGEWRAGRDL